MLKEQKHSAESHADEKVRKSLSILWYSLRIRSKEYEELAYLHWFLENCDLRSASFYLKVRKLIFLYVQETRKNISLLDEIKLKFGRIVNNFFG